MVYNLTMVFIIFAATIAIAYIISRNTKQEKNNLADTQKYCEDNNFEFVRNMTLEELPKEVQSFTMFQRHVGYKDFHSIVKGNHKNYDFSLFTFIYPGNSGTYGRLVCLINKKDFNLPKFYLRDTRAFADSVGKILGKQDINISEDKIFADKFLLQGSNTEETLNFFTEERRQILLKEHVKGYEYETDSEYFAISFPLMPSIPVNEYVALLNKTTSLLSKFGV